MTGRRRRRTPGGEGAYVGRHPAVVANSSAVVNGVLTATVLDGTSPDVDALVAHETFHVFCQLRHPHWSANEGAVFAYPDDDSNVLALRRLEAAALRRAVIDSSRGWAAAAMALRQECLARIPEDAARYQRDLERHEGLAFYVQGKVTGSILCLDRLAQPARPDEIRRTAYPIGEAIAVLLGGVLRSRARRGQFPCAARRGVAAGGTPYPQGGVSLPVRKGRAHGAGPRSHASRGIRSDEPPSAG